MTKAKKVNVASREDADFVYWTFEKESVTPTPVLPLPVAAITAAPVITPIPSHMIDSRDERIQTNFC